ncbi:hypothetical protein BVC80_967g4 [Macleaya cordata]|uniref:Uncharacterized protein n=1 Tax=Macleaya cordata TaxID=56857 RepID=A0A200QM86_MACCD|nr:hypothetical protein BVC80_967g4 [Macleaya cordata]
MLGTQMSRNFSPATTSSAGELTIECGEEGVYVHSNDWSVEAIAAFGSLLLPFLAIVEGKLEPPTGQHALYEPSSAEKRRESWGDGRAAEPFLSEGCQSNRGIKHSFPSNWVWVWPLSMRLDKSTPIFPPSPQCLIEKEKKGVPVCCSKRRKRTA